jgi:hypothetical protein
MDTDKEEDMNFTKLSPIRFDLMAWLLAAPNGGAAEGAGEKGLDESKFPLP